MSKIRITTTHGKPLSTHETKDWEPGTESIGLAYALEEAIQFAPLGMIKVACRGHVLLVRGEKEIDSVVEMLMIVLNLAHNA